MRWASARFVEGSGILCVDGLGGTSNDKGIVMGGVWFGHLPLAHVESAAWSSFPKDFR